MTYSRALTRRVLWLASVAVALLVLAGWWHRHRAVPTEGTRFEPARHVELSQRMARVLFREPVSSLPGPVSRPVCRDRELAVLTVRLMVTLSVDRDRAQALVQAAQSSSPPAPSCPDLTRAVLTAARLHAARSDADDASMPRIDQALAEDISWSRRLPCVEGQVGSRPVLVAGNPWLCGLQADVADLSGLPRDSSFQQAASRVGDAVANAALAGRFAHAGPLRVTLDEALHRRFDRWDGCLRQASVCAGALKSVQVAIATMVVMDADTGAVLGVWCHGQRCRRGPHGQLGPLAALLLDAPPASTTKLLHALVLARDGIVEPETLRRQIKTSGQLDGSVSKRNEWWERQVLCDSGTAQPAVSGCAVMAQAHDVATSMGFNAHCPRHGRPPGLDCGRVSLVQGEQALLLPGFLGRVAHDAPPGPVPLLRWRPYEEIRQGHRRPEARSGFTHTSQAVQSVLGAGQARISALGLAHVAAQLWHFSSGQPPVVPRLLQPAMPAPDHASSPVPAREQVAAATVLAGMRKVVEPAEPGWQGAGTASAAVQRQLGRACDGDCGLWGKTGTVSTKDRAAAGTTLFTGLVDTRALQQWSRQQVHLLPRRRLALGVIVMPSEDAGAVHAASHVAMALVKELLTP